MEPIKLPPDLTQLPQFRQLREELGDALKAFFIWWLLFQQLKYQEEETKATGRIAQADAGVFLKTLEDLARESGALPTNGKMLELLLKVKLLKADGPDYVCPRYQALNSPTATGMAKKGGDMKAFRSRQRTLDQDATQQALHLHESKFIDGEGLPLPADMVQRVTRTIIACDNALFKPMRPPAGFTEGLIQSALEVCQKFTPDQVTHICEQVALKRGHPRLQGYTTELLLPEFGNMLEKVGANG